MQSPGGCRRMKPARVSEKGMLQFGAQVFPPGKLMLPHTQHAPAPREGTRPTAHVKRRESCSAPREGTRPTTHRQVVKRRFAQPWQRRRSPLPCPIGWERCPQDGPSPHRSGLDIWIPTRSATSFTRNPPYRITFGRLALTTWMQFASRDCSYCDMLMA